MTFSLYVVIWKSKFYSGSSNKYKGEKILILYTFLENHKSKMLINNLNGSLCIYLNNSECF